jgi:hypothetical protein
MDQSESSASADQDSSVWIEMKDDTSTNSSSENIQSSRFRVAPVHGDISPCSQSMDFEDAVSSPVRPITPSHLPTSDHIHFSQVGSFAQRSLGYGNTYDTRNVRSLRHYTRDALPRADHYRNILSLQGQLCRPTLDELHGGQNTLTHELAVRAVMSVTLSHT